MNLNTRISAFSKLSDFMLAVAENNQQKVSADLTDDFLATVNLVAKLKVYNPWFIKDFVNNQLKAIALSSTKQKLENWILPYSAQIENQQPKKVAVIMAGNIPFVGFHDFISVLIAGHSIIMKLSSKDEHLPKKIAEVLIKIEPEFKEKIIFTEGKLTDFEAVIATGSNNTSRYFEYYFSKVPNINRKSRNSVAVLTGNENENELLGLADDIFLYFGLGCRNISKIFIPEDFNFDPLFEAFYKYKELINENKYANNFDYNRAIYLMNSVKFLENGFFIVREDFSMASPIAVLHYEKYSNIEHVKKSLKAQQDKIQCVVSAVKDIYNEVIDFGKAQFPE